MKMDTSQALHIKTSQNKRSEENPKKGLAKDLIMDSSYHRRKNLTQFLSFSIFRTASFVNGIALLIILYFMVINGWRAINWTFLSQAPTDSMTQGGILPCIVGTFSLSICAIIVALPIGIASAIFLNEYAGRGK